MRFDNRNLIIALFVLLFVGYVGFDLWYSNEGGIDEGLNLANEDNQQVVDLVNSEEALLSLTPKLKPLSRSVLNLQLPDLSATELFSDTVRITGVVESLDDLDWASTSPGFQLCVVLNESKELKRENLSLLSSLFELVEYFHHAKFYFVHGQFSDTELNRYDSVVGLNALASGKEGKTSIHATFNVGWTRQDKDSDWRISNWELSEFKAMPTTNRLFENVLPKVVDDPKLLRRATASRHSQLTSHLLAGNEYIFPPGETYPFFFPDVTLEHPGISVVDIDEDGFDDLYIAMQHDPNVLLRNIGDGTFEDVASAIGLNVLGDSTSSIFADFDNDGDQDLFLGRARRQSMYFVNEGGKFVDRSEEFINCDLPGLVSSISTADYDNDGLLDVYLCTYSPIEESNRFKVENKPLWVDLFLTPSKGQEVMRRNDSSHRFLDRAGPPNLLLRNTGGGKFEVAQENSQLELWRMSFHATWNDFDQDGDQDLYVANDYGADNLFRNDGVDGFRDITVEAGLTGMGFGMGVAWGDYDNDGRDDIYVSNMFSKAGQRIVNQVADVDPRIQEMADGNFLYRFDGEKFSLVSGLKDPKLKVAKAGWSWGGQFLDFDNDGFRDIYVTSGYYTAPSDIAVDLDL